jgi:hypothetical protein
MQHPTIDSQPVTEIRAFERQLHALLGDGIFSRYAQPTKHEIGMSLKQAALLAHDIEYMCQQQYEAYEEAETAVTLDDPSLLNTPIAPA